MKQRNRIDWVFDDLKQRKRKALIGYITAGFPNLRSLNRLVPLLEKSGLDILELGVPFSDPIADGPTIQQSSQAALAAGASLSWVLQQVALLRRTVRLPLVLMSYSNPIVAMSIKGFFQKAERAGVDGLIIPDLIPEESMMFDRAAARHGVHLIYLVSPTTPPERMRIIASKTRGFLYAVALNGVTGARAQLPPELPRFLRAIRRLSPYPVAVGFGLSTPAQVAKASRYADGVIVGSALVKETARAMPGGFDAAGRFVASLRYALDHLKGASHAS